MCLDLLSLFSNNFVITDGERLMPSLKASNSGEKGVNINLDVFLKLLSTNLFQQW
jgi:hypothetical protein